MKIFIKYTANIITICRMVLSVLLLFFLNNKPVYFFVYIICGLSDVLDGFVARKTNTQSILGARLDSAADFMMFGIITVSMIILTGNLLLRFVFYITAVAFIRIINVLIAFYKYNSFVMLHTWGNKITGLIIFLTPVLYLKFNNVNIILAVCIIAALTALEESIIHLTSEKFDINRRSLFIK